MINKTFHSDLAIPPGEYLEEIIESLGMSKDELARRMNRPAAKLSAIFSGEKSITPETALQLERVVNVPAHIWTGLESEYRLTLARQIELEEDERLKTETHLVSKYCFAALAKVGFVKKVTRPIDKVRELLSFFGVTSLENIPAIKRYQVAFRSSRSSRFQRSPEALIAWLRIGELIGAKSNCKQFSKPGLRALIPEIRALTLISPEDSIPRLEKLLLDVGIALIMCPHLPKTYAHGATFWQGPNKAIVMLSLRGKWADIFWFSLLHEIGHLILHGKKNIFIDGEVQIKDNEKYEIEADDFASNALIPKSQFQEFVINGKFYENDIIDFAEQVGIHPGIIVGRLKHHKLIDLRWHNGLRDRYEFVNC